MGDSKLESSGTQTFAPDMVEASSRRFPFVASWLRRSVASTAAWVMVTLSLAGATGCITTPFGADKQQAEGRWMSMRGAIKLTLAEQQFQAGDLEEAEATIKEAISLDPSCGPAHLLAAKIHMEAGRLDEAEKSIKIAERTGAPRGDTEYLRGLAAQRAGDAAAAQDHYDGAMTADPQSIQALYGALQCRIVQGRLDDANDLLAKNMSRFDRDVELKVIRAQLLDMMERNEESAAAFAEAMSLAPDRLDVREQYGLVLMDCRRYDDALAVLKPVTDQPPGNVPGAVHRAVATAHLMLGHAGDARAVLDAYLNRRGDDARAWLLLSRTALTAGDLPSSRHSAEQACRLSPDAPAAQLMRGYVCWKQSDFTAAGEALEKALTLAPDDALTMRVLAMVRADMGQESSAQDLYRRALELDPDFEGAARLAGSPR